MLCRLAVILALIIQPALAWDVARAAGSDDAACAAAACCCAVASPATMGCCGPGPAACNCGAEPDDRNPAAPPPTSGLDLVLLLAPVSGACGIEWGDGPIIIGHLRALFPLPSENNTRQALLCVWRT